MLKRSGMKNSIILPQWLDDMIYNEYHALYDPCPDDVMSNADKDYDFAKLYLGTYFPRSYAEAYCILGTLLENQNYFQVMNGYENLNILDFCSGTGGEIFGLISILHSNLPNLKSIHIDAFDANPDYIRFLFHLSKSLDEDIEVTINPQCFFIESDQNLHDIINATSKLYHIFLSFKALNEFIQHDVFPNENIYRKIAEAFLPCLTNDGILLVSDLTHKDKKYGVFYPEVMNDGLNSFLRSSDKYKSLYPYPCFLHEQKCPGCYMQDRIYVSHSKKERDISKIAYRVIGNSDFVTRMMQNISPQQNCRAIYPQADMTIPYHKH